MSRRLFFLFIYFPSFVASGKSLAVSPCQLVLTRRFLNFLNDFNHVTLNEKKAAPMESVFNFFFFLIQQEHWRISAERRVMEWLTLAAKINAPINRSHKDKNKAKEEKNSGQKSWLGVRACCSPSCCCSRRPARRRRASRRQLSIINPIRPRCLSSVRRIAFAKMRSRSTVAAAAWQTSPTSYTASQSPNCKCTPIFFLDLVTLFTLALEPLR